jgi:hypothetical protein
MSSKMLEDAPLHKVQDAAIMRQEEIDAKCWGSQSVNDHGGRFGRFPSDTQGFWKD